MRFVRLRSYLSRVISAYSPVVMAYEQVFSHGPPSRQNTYAAQTYGGIVATLSSFCDELDPKLPYTPVPVQAVKKMATGSGNASKDMMCAAARIHWPDRTLVGDDEADARYIAVVAARTADLPEFRTAIIALERQFAAHYKEFKRPGKPARVKQTALALKKRKRAL